MADINKILEESSVVLGYILSRFNLKFQEDYINVKKYSDLMQKYCKNINKCSFEMQQIENHEDIIQNKDLIANGLKLGRFLYEKLKVDDDIYWLGRRLESKYPIDIKIGETCVSFREEKYLLKNPSFADYLNALIQPVNPIKKINVFKSFSSGEFEKWLFYANSKLMDEFNKHKTNDIIISYTQRGPYIKKGTTGLIFVRDSKQIEVGINENIHEISLNSRLKGYLYEHTVSRWIKKKLEKEDAEYEKLKKECLVKTSGNLKAFIIERLNLNSNGILELFQIYDNPYYYLKSFGETQLYQIPGNSDCKVKLINIEIAAPESELNSYFTFEITNSNGSHEVTLRIEFRYMHGILNGIPDSKLYYPDNKVHLINLYKIIK